jgi:hypothetical protein
MPEKCNALLTFNSLIQEYKINLSQEVRNGIATRVARYEEIDTNLNEFADMRKVSFCT